MKHIFLLVDDDFPSTKAAPLMMRQLAREFHRQGYNVFLISPSSEVQGHFEINEEEGISIVHFYSPPLKNVNKLKRAIRESLLSYRLFRTRKLFFRQGKSLLVYYSPSIFFGPFVCYMKKRLNCVSYLILRDIFPQWAVDTGIMSKYSPIYIYFKIFEFINYYAANRIGVQTTSNLDFFTQYPKFKQKAEVLFNWFDSSKLNTGNGLRERYELEDKIIYFFGGNIGHAQDMMNIFRLAKVMQPYEKAFFLLVGKGDEFDLLKEQIQSFGLKNILLLPQVPQNEYFEMLSQIDIGLFSLHSGHLTQNIPGKTFGYMAYSKPILGSINQGNDLLRIVMDNEAGLVSINPDDDAFFSNACMLLNSEELRMKFGQNGRQLIDSVFSVASSVKQIVNVVEQR